MEFGNISRGAPFQHNWNRAKLMEIIRGLLQNVRESFEIYSNPEGSLAELVKIYWSPRTLGGIPCSMYDNVQNPWQTYGYTLQDWQIHRTLGDRKAYPLQNVWKAIEILTVSPCRIYQHLLKAMRVLRGSPCRMFGVPGESQWVPLLECATAMWDSWAWWGVAFAQM